MSRKILPLKTFIVLTFLCGFSVIQQNPAKAQSTKKFSKDLDDLMSKITEKIKAIPGISIVVVKGDKPIFMKSYGYADIANKYPAKKNTPYYIASSTKSFMGMAAAILDHQGKISLDANLAESIPYIKFKPKVKANKVKLRDLLTHTSGVKNSYFGYRAAYSGNIDRKEMDWVLENKTGRRHEIGKYRYDNLGYNIYSHMTDKKLGKPWQDLLSDLIFKPLKMKRTTAYMSKAQKKGWKYAKPYYGIGLNGIEELYLMKKDNTMQSAGGLITTVEDMANWLIFNLNKGKFRGKQIVPAEVVKMAHSKLVSQGRTRGTYKRDGYGLGWEIGTYKNKKIVQHDGGFAGFICHVVMMPEEKLGVNILINDVTIGGSLTSRLSQYVFDWWLNGGKTDKKPAEIVNYYLTRIPDVQQRIKVDLEKRSKRKWMLTEPLQSYVGTYYNKNMGKAYVKIKDGVLEVTHGNLRSKSTPFVQKNTIRVEMVPKQGWVVGFKIEPGKKASAMDFDGDLFKRID